MLWITIEIWEDKKKYTETVHGSKIWGNRLKQRGNHLINWEFFLNIITILWINARSTMYKYIYELAFIPNYSLMKNLYDRKKPKTEIFWQIKRRLLTLHDIDGVWCKNKMSLKYF